MNAWSHQTLTDKKYRWFDPVSERWLRDSELAALDGKGDTKGDGKGMLPMAMNWRLTYYADWTPEQNVIAECWHDKNVLNKNATPPMPQ